MKKAAPALTAKRLNSPRQFRALSELMEGPCTVRQLLAAVGGNGIPQLVAGLRRKGLVIDTTPCPGTDRDNRRCIYGEYSLRPISRPVAKWLMQDFNSQGIAQHAEE